MPRGIIAMLFMAGLVSGVALLGWPAWLLAVYLGASMVTLLLYAHDKAAAQGDRRRTPECTLHLCALLGGWPGALIAQSWLRHKNRKTSFQVTFWITVVVNAAALFGVVRGGLLG